MDATTTPLRAPLPPFEGSDAARDFIGLVDFTTASRDPRFHVVDLRNGQVESFRVAHGSGSDPSHDGYLERFSNEFGSYATSNGTYTTGEYYHGKYGLSMKTHGRDWSNNNAMARAIVIHNAWYAEPEVVEVPEFAGSIVLRRSRAVPPSPSAAP